MNVDQRYLGALDPPLDTRRWDIGPPSGESIKAVFERVATGLTVLADDFAGRDVVLVAHGFVAKVIRALSTDLPWDEFFRYALAQVAKGMAPRIRPLTWR